LLCRQIGGFFISAEALESSYFSRCPQIEGNTSIDNVIVNTSDTTAVPGSLPLFGAAAAFGYSRKLRKRILTSKG
jgi:hypothetical protein